MKKSSVRYSILKYKCPRCHGGDLFVEKSAYSKGFLKMHRKCSECEQTYTPEPGFYFGAAYISYMIVVAISVITFLLLFFVLNIRNTTLLIALIIAASVLAAPVNFRLSRSIWAHIFIRYRPSLGKKVGTNAAS